MASIRIQHRLFGLLGMLLLSALSVTGALEIYTHPEYVTTCGENLTLTCNVKHSKDLRFMRFCWMMKEDICFWEKDTNQTDFECKSKSYKTTLSIYNFSLNIFNVQPKHMGTYVCQLHSMEGVKNSQTILRIKKCVGNSTINTNTTEATCTFRDVFPKPSVRWSRGLEDLTHLATTEVTNNTDGLFTAVSTIKMKTENSSHPDKCSLMIENETVDQVNILLKQSIKSSGGYIHVAHCFGFLMVMVLGMSMV